LDTDLQWDNALGALIATGFEVDREWEMAKAVLTATGHIGHVNKRLKTMILYKLHHKRYTSG